MINFVSTLRVTTRLIKKSTATEWNQEKIPRNGELTWPAHMLTDSSHVLVMVPVLALQKSSGWPFWSPYRNVNIPAYNQAQNNQLRKATEQN